MRREVTLVRKIQELNASAEYLTHDWFIKVNTLRWVLGEVDEL